MFFTIETEYKDCPGCGQEISARVALCDHCQWEKEMEAEGLCGAGWIIDGAPAANAFTLPDCERCDGTGLIHPEND